MRAFHIALKDVRVWVRDISALGVLLGMPIVLIFILGSALGDHGQDLRVKAAVVNLDSGAPASAATGTGGGQPATGAHTQGGTGRLDLGSELVTTLKDSKRINDVFILTYPKGDTDAQLLRAARGELGAVLVIPEDFSAKVQAGTPVRLLVYTDPGAQLSAKIFTGVIGSFAAEYSAASVAAQTVISSAGRGAEAEQQAGALAGAAIAAATSESAQPVKVVDEESQTGTRMTALDYYAVSMTSMFLMFGAMFGAFATIRERREQTLSRLLSTPVSAFEVTAGKMLGIFALGMLQFCVLYLSTRFIFGVQWGTDVLAVFLVAAAEMLAVTGLAVLIASLAKSERGAGGLGPLVIQIQALLGGAFFAITILPAWLQPVRYVSVVGWALEGWQTVQLRGGTVVDVVAPVGALLGFALLFFTVGSLLTGVRR